MPAGPLDLNGWKKHMDEFLDESVTSAILGICHYEARIGYERPRDSINIYPNLSKTQENEEIVTEEIVSKLADNGLKYFTKLSHLPTYYRASPLGLVDKSDGTKRQIYYLSYSPEEGSSINCGIPEHYGTIT